MTRVVMVERIGEEILVSDLRRARGIASFWRVKRRSFLAANIKGLELKRGDFVEIFLPAGRTVLQSVITFLLPLILFPITYAIVAAFAPEAGDGILFSVSFGALLLGFPFGAFLYRIVGMKVPTISRVLTDEDALKLEDCLGCGVCVDLDSRMRQ